MWEPCSCWAGEYQSLPEGLSPEAWALANEVPRNSFQGDSRPKHRQVELQGHQGSRDKC